MKTISTRTLCGLAMLTLIGSAVIPALSDPPKGSKTSAPHPAGAVAGLTLLPAETVLDGSYSFQTLSAVAKSGDNSERDVSSGAAFSSSNAAVVKVSNGIAYPVGDGTAEITVSVGGKSAKSKIVVKNSHTDSNLSFENTITPILVKNGCVGSACHGSAKGQGGFKVSYFGYEPQKDWESIAKGDNGRRVNFAKPELSLIVLKPTGKGHVGGKRFEPEGPEARLFTAWVKAGAPFKPGDSKKQAAIAKSGTRLAGFEDSKPSVVVPKLLGIEVAPGFRLIHEANTIHQLIVTAKYSDGSVRDVTPFSRYVCDDDGIAAIFSLGKLTALRRGEANIMVRYAGKVGLAQFIVQPQTPIANYPNLPVSNFIDKAVYAKLKTLNIVPSELCDDATYIRRIYFDLIGTPPLPPMVRQFVEDNDSQKRTKLVDELLQRPEFKDYQTIIWSDLLRNTRQLLEEDGVKAYTSFIRESFAENKPFDQFVRELLTAQGSTFHNETAPANYFRVTGDATELTTSTTQIFLGVRTDCARCHNHPFDRWSQDDFYGFASFFARVQQYGGTADREIVIKADGESLMRQPRTGQLMPPKFLTAELPLADTKGDIRVALANWITAKDNPFFAKATVNRIWKQFFGRGIVQPVDDFRATNPPINAPLLNALADDFTANGYDLRHLIRTICTSRIYQLSSKVNSTNADDTKNFSHYFIKRLGPSQLLDTLTVATGVEENFPGVRPGTKAINLLDNSVGSYFLDVFGRSRRLQVAEPSQETSMSQALALMNGGTVNNKIAAPNGRLAQLIARLGDRSEKALLTELYLATLARFPSDAEVTQASTYIKKIGNPREAYEDLMWAMINSKEFLFNH